MVRHTGTVMVIMKEKVYTHRSLATRGKHATQSHMGRIRVGQVAEKEKGEDGAKPLLEFLWEGMDKAGR